MGRTALLEWLRTWWYCCRHWSVKNYSLTPGRSWLALCLTLIQGSKCRRCVVARDELKDESRFDKDVQQDLVNDFAFSVDVLQRDGWQLSERRLWFQYFVCVRVPLAEITTLYLKPVSASSSSAQRTLYTAGMVFCCLLPSILIIRVDCGQWRVSRSFGNQFRTALEVVILLATTKTSCQCACFLKR
jgi:hypothetical protein